MGADPTTSRVTGECSTVELQPHLKSKSNSFSGFRQTVKKKKDGKPPDSLVRIRGHVLRHPIRVTLPLLALAASGRPVAVALDLPYFSVI